MLEAVLAIDTPPEWKRELIDKYHATIDILDCQTTGESGGRVLVSIGLEDRHAEMAIEDIRRNPRVLDVDLRRVDRGRLKGIVAIDECVACCRLVGPEVFLVESSLGRDGLTVWRLIFLERPAINHVIFNLEAQGCVVELRKLMTLDPPQLMTSRQEEVLLVAYERGYFDYPKGTSLRDLAKMFQVSISTLSELLRKGQQSVMEQYFQKRGPSPGMEG